MGEFLAWLEASGHVVEVEAVTKRDVAAYAEYLTQSRPKHDDGSGRVTGALSAGAVGRHVAAVRGVLAMLHHGGELASDPASGVEVVIAWAEDAGHGGAVLSQCEVRALYAATETQKERAVLALGYGCGLRIAEAQKLDIGAVRFGGSSGCGTVTVERGKGERRRVVPLSRQAYAMSWRIITTASGRSKRCPDRSALGADPERRMVSGCGRGPTARVLGQVVARAVAQGRLEAGVIGKRVTFHGLRHAVATHLLERGLTLAQVSLFLGHRHPETTEVYTHVSAGMLGELVGS